MGILNPPPFPTADRDKKIAMDSLAEFLKQQPSSGPEPAGDDPNLDMICAAVSAAVSAGVHAAIDAIGGPSVESALTYAETELLDAYRNAGELHRTTALRTLQRGVDTKDE
jgi:hypothetical protein